MLKQYPQFYINALSMVFLAMHMSPLQAAERNYSSRQLPSVYKLELDGNDILVKLGGSYSRENFSYTPESLRPLHRLAPVIRYTNGKWSMDGQWDCGDCSNPPYSPATPCSEKIPLIPAMKHPDIHQCSEYPNRMCVSGEALGKMGFGRESINPNAKWDYEIDEFPSECDVDDEAAWFGVNFYGGEGFIGMGGIGRFDRKTAQLEVRRPVELATYGVKRVVRGGDWIWAATTANTEGGGAPPALGLIRYNWLDGRLESFLDSEEGMCGFVIYDLLRAEDNVWVATDVGLSRWNESEEIWYNYLPLLGGAMSVPEVKCDAVYRQLLRNLPKEDEAYYEMTYARSYYDLLLKNLRLYRKEFIKNYEATQ
jgi:hypothetical protein